MKNNGLGYVIRTFLSCLLALATGCAAGPQSHSPQLRVGDREVVNPPGLTPLVPVYSVAIRAGDQIYLSGLTGVKPGSQVIIEGGVGPQTRQTLENIRATLHAAGARMTDVTECTVFLLDMADYVTMNNIYAEFFPVAPPARATVAVSMLPRPTARVEIKCSARLGGR